MRRATLTPAEIALMTFAAPGTALPEDDRKAVAMLAAAVSYHRRERKSFWWAHFDRCENGPDTHRPGQERVPGRGLPRSWTSGSRSAPSFLNAGSS